MPSRKKPPDKPSNGSSGGRTPPNWLALCLLVVLAVLTYADSLHGKLIFDDLSIVLQNTALMNVKTLSDAMSPVVSGGWRQLLFSTYALNYYWSGLDTFSYHVVNV